MNTWEKESHDHDFKWEEEEAVTERAARDPGQRRTHGFPPPFSRHDSLFLQISSCFLKCGVEFDPEEGQIGGEAQLDEYDEHIQTG